MWTFADPAIRCMIDRMLPATPPEVAMPLALEVARSAAVTPRIKSVKLVAAAGGALPAFTAGAHIDVSLGNGETRSYSLLNDCTETHRYVVRVSARNRQPRRLDLGARPSAGRPRFRKRRGRKQSYP